MHSATRNAVTQPMLAGLAAGGGYWAVSEGGFDPPPRAALSLPHSALSRAGMARATLTVDLPGRPSRGGRRTRQ